MSLLKWKELAKSKSELGNKINYVHNAITKHDIDQQTSQQGFSKVFKPITSKLDDVIDSNQVLRMPRKKRPLKKGEVPDYGIDIEDEVPDMNLGDLFEQPVLPQQEKQLIPKPPTYEESLQDILEGKKEIYVDPQEPQLPPEYDDDDEIDYGLDDEDMDNEILNDLGLQNYDSVDSVPFQQNHNFEDQDHSISHCPCLHHLIHNLSHRRHHILVVIVVPEDQHKSLFFLPEYLVKILHMLAVLVSVVFLAVVKQVVQNYYEYNKDWVKIQ